MENTLVFEKHYPEYNAYRYHFDFLDSTQLYCKRNLSQFINSGKLKSDSIVIISCNEQQKGVGTRDTKNNVDRIWVSENGDVFITFVFLLNKKDTKKSCFLAQTSTVVVSKTLEFYNLKIQIKWINDVLINNRKISGSLINLVHINDSHLSDDYVCILCGIGVNVNLNNDKNVLNNNFTSIKMELEKNCNNTIPIPSVEDVTNKLIENFHLAIKELFNKGFSSFIDYIIIRLLYKEKKVIIDQDNNQIVGYLKGLSDDGSILLLDDQNNIINVNNGHLLPYIKN